MQQHDDVDSTAAANINDTSTNNIKVVADGTQSISIDTRARALSIIHNPHHNGLSDNLRRSDRSFDVHELLSDSSPPNSSTDSKLLTKDTVSCNRRFFECYIIVELMCQNINPYPIMLQRSIVSSFISYLCVASSIDKGTLVQLSSEFPGGSC